MARKLPGRARKPVDVFSLPTPPEYRCRFVDHARASELVNLYHLARIALAGKPTDEQTPYHRMIWASAQFARGSNSVSATGAYKDLCGLLGR